MKRSGIVTLAISGALVLSASTGCDDNSKRAMLEANDEPALTNNTYHASHGYWHAPYRAWYPYPYNYYDESRGYYHGGTWSSTPHASSVTSSRPTYQGASSEPGSASHSTGSISRGGFGGHGSSVAS